MCIRDSSKYLPWRVEETNARTNRQTPHVANTVLSYTPCLHVRAHAYVLDYLLNPLERARTQVLADTQQRNYRSNRINIPVTEAHIFSNNMFTIWLGNALLVKRYNITKGSLLPNAFNKT